MQLWRLVAEVEIGLDGVFWNEELAHFFALPCDQGIGGLFRPSTRWGAAPGHLLFPAGCWMDGARLRAGEGISDFDSCRGVAVPAAVVDLVDGSMAKQFAIQSGFVLGALVKSMGLSRVYLVLYRREQGWFPREVELPSPAGRIGHGRKK